MSEIGLPRISSADLLNAVARGAESMLAEHGWPDGVDSLLAELGGVTGVSRAWIFQKLELTEDYIIQDYVFEWASAPHHVQIDLPMFSLFRTKRDNPEYDQLVRSRLRGEHQAVIVGNLEDCWLRGNLAMQNILSMLTIPIMVDGEWWGILGFDDCEREYEWSEAEVALLRTAANLISGAIVRSRLQARVRQFQIMKSLTSSATFSVDLRRGRLWVSGDLLNDPGVGPEGRHFSMLGALRRVHPKDRHGLLEALRRSYVTGRGPLRIDIRIRAKGENYRWVELIGDLDRDGVGDAALLSGIALDIRHRKRVERALRRQAGSDPLTGARNRRTFMDDLEMLVGTVGGDNGPLSLLILDLDHFKEINDTWGHPAGDKALKVFVDICRSSLRDGDLLARIGGEEFAVLLPGTDRENARHVGERIRKAVQEETVRFEDARFSLTVSIGCATCPKRSGDLPALRDGGVLFSMADRALYRAKQDGRNRLVCADVPGGA